MIEESVMLFEITNNSFILRNFLDGMKRFGQMLFTIILIGLKKYLNFNHIIVKK